MTTRFPDAPLSINSDIWKITDTTKLQELVLELIKARNIDDFVQVLKTYAKGIAADNQQ